MDSAGCETKTLGAPGRQAGRMVYPTGIAIDRATGNIYVVDSGNHRVQKFASDGAFLCEAGSAGAFDGQFGNPKAIVCARGLVLVSDAGNHRIAVFDAQDLSFVRHIGSGRKGHGVDEFNCPDGLAVCPTRSGDRMLQAGGTEGTTQEASEASLIAPPPASSLLFVADTENHRVKVVDLASGWHLRSIGKGEGTKPGQMQLPGGVAVDAKQRLLVSECRGQRLQLFSLEGEPLQLVHVPPFVPHMTAKRPAVLRGVCCSEDDEGKAYVCDFANHRIGVVKLMLNEA